METKINISIGGKCPEAGSGSCFEEALYSEDGEYATDEDAWPWTQIGAEEIVRI